MFFCLSSLGCCMLRDKFFVSCRIFVNFAIGNRAEELAHTSEKVLFELSLLSKFSQNLLINRKIGQITPTSVALYLPTSGTI